MFFSGISWNQNQNGDIWGAGLVAAGNAYEGVYALYDPANSTDRAFGVRPYKKAVIILFTDKFLVPGAIQRRVRNPTAYTVQDVRRIML